MRRLVLRVIDGAAALGFALFGLPLLVFAIGLMIGGGWPSVLGLVLGVVGVAAIGAALESWFGWHLRWRPAWIVAASLVAYLILTVLALQNIGP